MADFDGGAEGRTLSGTAENDVFVDAGGEDVFNGGADENPFIPEIEGGLMFAQAGGDLLDYGAAPAGVVVDLQRQTASDGYGGMDSVVEFERVIGSVHDDVLGGDADLNVLDGGAGNDWFHAARETVFTGITTPFTQAGLDRLIGGDGFDTASYDEASAGVSVRLGFNGEAGVDSFGNQLSGIEIVAGSSHDDAIVGNEGENFLAGGGGNDILTGHGGDDVLVGGAGFDTVSYGDFLPTNGVVASLVTGASDDGFGTADTLDGIEALYGSVLDDYLAGSFGADVLGGNSGDDTLVGHAGGDLLIGDTGTDTVSYALASAAVAVGLYAELAYDGEGGIDTVWSVENVVGSAHADYLAGEAGANVLTGGGGADDLYGLGGGDAFSFAPGDSQGDVVHDFASGEDTIMLTGFGADPTTAFATYGGYGILGIYHASGVDYLLLENVTSLQPDDILFA